MGEFLSVFLDTRIETGLQAGAAVLLVAFCSRVLLRNRRKRFCCALWMLVFIRFLCPLTLPAPAGMLADRAASAAAWQQALTEKLWGQADRAAETEYLPEGQQVVSAGEAPRQQDGMVGLSGEISGRPGEVFGQSGGTSGQSDRQSAQAGESSDLTGEAMNPPRRQSVQPGEISGQSGRAFDQSDRQSSQAGEASGLTGETMNQSRAQLAQPEEATGQPGGADPPEARKPSGTGSAVGVEGPLEYADRAAFGAIPPRKLTAGIVWLSGIIGLSAVSLFRYRRIRKRLCTAVRVPAGAYAAQPGRSFGVPSVTDRGFAGVREIRESDRIAGPFVLGVFRPVIYLPAGLAEEERACVLAHEAAHIRRKDHLVKPVCFLAVVLNWMNPLAWAAFRLMGQDMETACDELALEGAGKDVCIRYSKTLLRTAARQSRLPVPLFFGEGNTKRRVKNVLQIGRKKPVGPLLAAALAAAVAVGIFIGVSPRQEGPEEAGPLSGRAEETAASGEDAESAGQSAQSASPEGTEAESDAERSGAESPAGPSEAGFHAEMPGTGFYTDGLEIASYAAAPGEQKDMILNGVNVTQQYRDAEENFEALQVRLVQIRTEQEEIQRRVERLGEAAEEATEEERQEKIRAYRDVLREQTEKENALMEAEKQLAAERARLRQLVITLGKGYDLVAKRREELESLPAELTPEQLDKRGIYMEEDPKTRERLQEFADLTEYRGALQDEDGASWAWLDDTQITETVPGGEWNRSEKKITAMTIRLGSRAEDGSLTVCSVTALGDGYLVLTDRSREKGLEESADSVTEEYYGFLNWFSEEDGEYVIASDDPSVTMQELFDSQLSSRYGAAIPHARIASLPAEEESSE